MHSSPAEEECGSANTREAPHEQKSVPEAAKATQMTCYCYYSRTTATSGQRKFNRVTSPIGLFGSEGAQPKNNARPRRTVRRAEEAARLRTARGRDSCGGNSIQLLLNYPVEPARVGDRTRRRAVLAAATLPDVRLLGRRARRTAAH